MLAATLYFGRFSETPGPLGPSDGVIARCWQRAAAPLPAAQQSAGHQEKGSHPQPPASAGRLPSTVSATGGLVRETTCRMGNP